MSRQPSIIFKSCARFDMLKAIGVSRYHPRHHIRADAARRGVRLPPLAISTGRIHADKTRDTYKDIALCYVHWARDMHGIRRLADLDNNAERLVALHLVARCDAGDSLYTLTTTRAALRMFHRPAYPEENARRAWSSLALISPSGGVKQSRGVSIPWPWTTRSPSMTMLTSSRSARRRGCASVVLEALVVATVQADTLGHLIVEVRNGKSGKCRPVHVLPGSEEVRHAATCWPHHFCALLIASHGPHTDLDRESESLAK